MEEPKDKEDWLVWEPDVKWRRATKGEALRSVPLYFSVAMLIGLVSDVLLDGAPDYQGSFYRALCFAVGMPIASLLLKLKAD